MKKTIYMLLTLLLVFSLASCSSASADSQQEAITGSGAAAAVQETPASQEPASQPQDVSELPAVSAGETARVKSLYTDPNGDTAVIPADFTVSAEKGEFLIRSGLVVTGPDGSEYVWIPTTVTALERREFGSYFSGMGSLSNYNDETNLPAYQAMVASVERYGGFYLGRYETSVETTLAGGSHPVSKPVTKDNPGTIWVRYSPQNTVALCEQLYADNDTVQGFFPWGINWDTALQWLIDSGCKTTNDVTRDSTSWGNYSDDTFSVGMSGNLTGQWEETKTNNIYDLAGNNWEWTQERSGGSYVMRGGGYNLMGGACPGSKYPAALRDPLPGNDHHPNVTFRLGLYVE